MPILLAEETISLEFSDMSARSCAGMTGRIDTKPRPKGIHQSGVLKYIATKMKILKPGEKLEDDYPLIWAMGVMWEEFAVSLYPEIEWQPGSLCHNGIWRSLDGLGFRPGFLRPVRIEEFKFTYKKVRTGAELLEDFLWMHQGRGYLSGWNETSSFVARYGDAARLDTVRWHVMFCKGDYKEFGPIYKTYTVQFSPSEIAQTEKMLCANKGKVEPE